MPSLSSSTFFYGVFVKTIDLCMTAREWKDIQPAFRAIDLIQLRRSTGKLRFGAGTSEVNAGALPSELWDKIKQEMCDDAALEAEDAYFRDLHRVNLDPDERKQDDSAVTDFTFAHLSDCDICADEFWSNGGLQELLNGSEEVIKELLSAFGLSCPSGQSASAEEWPSTDFDALSPVALLVPPSPASSSSSTPSSYNSVVIQNGYCRLDLDLDYEQYDTVSQVVKFSPSSFSLPLNTSSRFNTFFRLFLYLLESHPTDTAMLSAPDAKKEDKAKRLTSEPSTSTAPAWHLWTSGSNRR